MGGPGSYFEPLAGAEADPLAGCGEIEADRSPEAEEDLPIGMGVRGIDSSRAVGPGVAGVGLGFEPQPDRAFVDPLSVFEKMNGEMSRSMAAVR